MLQHQKKQSKIIVIFNLIISNLYLKIENLGLEESVLGLNCIGGKEVITLTKLLK